MGKLILIPIIIIIGAAVAFFILSIDGPKVDSNGVIDCGVSKDINKLPEIIDKVQQSHIIDLNLNNEQGLFIYDEETGGLINSETGEPYVDEPDRDYPRTTDFSKDEAILCMDEALEDCKKAKVIINQNYVSSDYSSDTTYSIESKGMFYNNTYDKIGTCLVEITSTSSSYDGNSILPWTCNAEKGGFAKLSCGIYETCSWKESPGANVRGLFGSIEIGLILMLVGEDEYEGELYCTPDYLNAQQDEKPTKCEDTDGGQDIYTKGTVTLTGNDRISSSTDTCSSKNQVDEVYCSNWTGTISTLPSPCPSGYDCEDGACVEEN